MRKHIYKISGIALILITLFISLSFVFPVSKESVQTSKIEFKTIKDGIEYAEATKIIDKQPVKMNLLRLDLTKVRLDVVHAKDKAIGTETVSEIAKNHGAFAAINAGFFRLDKSVFAGDSAGVLQIDGKLLSESYKDRIALGIINGKRKTEVEIGHLQSASTVQFGIDSKFTFSGINRERKDDEIIMFNPNFNKTTLTDSSGTEIILSKCSRRCNKVEIFENKGNSIIPSDGFVISIGKDANDNANNIRGFASVQKNSKKSSLGITRLLSNLKTTSS
ncbi:MAG: hypothetical protein ACR2MB_16245, partial [Acidimicrobiales bacterium]